MLKPKRVQIIALRNQGFKNTQAFSVPIMLLTLTMTKNVLCCVNNGVTQHTPFLFNRVTRLPLVRDMFLDRILIKTEWSVSISFLILRAN